MKGQVAVTLALQNALDAARDLNHVLGATPEKDRISKAMGKLALDLHMEARVALLYTHAVALGPLGDA